MSFSTWHFPMSSYTCILHVELDVAKKNIKKPMTFQTFHPPTSTYTCILHVQLDVGQKKIKKNSVFKMLSSTCILQV